MTPGGLGDSCPASPDAYAGAGNPHPPTQGDKGKGKGEGKGKEKSQARGGDVDGPVANEGAKSARAARTEQQRPKRSSTTKRPN